MVSNCPKGQRQKYQPILVNDTNVVYYRGMYTVDRWKRRKWSIFRAGLRKFSQTAEHVKGVWKEELESDVEYAQALGGSPCDTTRRGGGQLGVARSAEAGAWLRQARGGHTPGHSPRSDSTSSHSSADTPPKRLSFCLSNDTF